MAKKIILSLIILMIYSASYAATITVFAAANLSNVFEEIVKSYKLKYPSDEIKVVYGSSGKAFNQVINGAPFDLFFSADMDFIMQLEKKGLLLTKPKPYAIGKIILWTKKDSHIDVSKGLSILYDNKISKIAIANPKLAPYGEAALECIKYNKIYDKVQGKIVNAENVSQALQYAQSGAVEVSFIPLSLTKTGVAKEGNFFIIPKACHSPIYQGYAILKNASSSDKYTLSQSFYDFISTPAVSEKLLSYGYDLPK